MLSAAIFYVVISRLLHEASAAPVPNTETVGWVSDPDGRGTFGLISSCVITQGLCVWSALHLNIAPRYKTKSQRIWYDVKLVVLGILIPELIILCAWRQWLSARRMTVEMKAILEQETKSKKDTSSKETTAYLLSKSTRNEWTRIHSLYAGMGGFAFDVDQLPEGEDAFIPGHERLHLSPLGVLLLAKCGCLPDVSLQDIKDKSKADALAKTIVIFQAGWFIVQTIARVVSNQPVTLLEINTIGHIVCAFIIYLLWWHKPKEVKEPTVLKGRDVPFLCAFFYLSSRISGERPDRRIRMNKWTKPELSAYEWNPEIVESTEECPTSPVRLPKSQTYEKIAPVSTVAAHECIAENLSAAGTEGWLVRRQLSRKETEDLAKRRLPFKYLPVPGDTEHKKELRRLAASYALRNFPALQAPILQDSSKPRDATEKGADNSAHRLEPQQLLAAEASDWPSDYYLPGLDGQLMGTVLWLTAMVYGAIHVAAWQDFFPTYAERVIWHFSAIYITSASALWFVVNMIAVRFNWASVWWDKFVALEKGWIQYVFWLPIAGICGLAYVFARAFLVVGAVVSLRKVPSAAYQTPQWSELLPHF